MSNSLSAQSDRTPRVFVRYYLAAAAPVLVVAAAGVAFKDFVSYAVTTNIVVNIIILTTALAGIVIIMSRIRGIARELRGFGFLASGPIDEVSHRAVEGLLSGQAILRLDALRGVPLSTVDQGHVHQDMSNLRDALDARQELGQYLVGLMVALGLLGTFIGLLETLLGVGQLIGSFGVAGSGSLDDSFRSLVGDLQRPLAAMGTAFAASMFGLLGSVVLGLMQIVVRNAQAFFISYANGVANEIADAPLSLDSKDPQATEEWVLAALDQLAASQRVVVDQIRILGEDAQQSGARAARLSDTVETLATLGEVLVEVQRSQARTLDQLERLPTSLDGLASATAATQVGLSELARDLGDWRNDESRRQLVAARAVSRAVRAHEQRLTEKIEVVADQHRSALEDFGRRQEIDERQSSREHQSTLSSLSEMVRSIETLGQIYADDRSSREAAQTVDRMHMQALLDQLENVAQTLGSAHPEPKTGPAQFDDKPLLRRLDGLEQLFQGDLRTAVKAIIASRRQD